MAETQSPEVRIAKEKVSALVQDLLVMRLRKHEIDTERAKTIARAVVAALQGSYTVEEVEAVLPTVSTEFFELQEILLKANDVCRHEIEQKVTDFVHALIATGHFPEAAKLAEDAFTRLSKRPVDCAQAERDIEHEYHVLSHDEVALAAEQAMKAELAPSTHEVGLPGTEQESVVPIPKPIPEDLSHLSPEDAHSPTNQTMPKPEEVVPRFENDQTETIPGSDEHLVPVQAPIIPRDVRLPDKAVAAKDLQTRAAEVMTEERQEKLHHAAESLAKSVKAIGTGIVEKSKEFATTAEETFEKKQEEHTAKKEAEQKEKDEF